MQALNNRSGLDGRQKGIFCRPLRTMFQKTIFFFYTAEKYTTLKAFHERFSVKFFFAAVFTTLWAVLELRERRWQIVRLKMVLILKLCKIVRDEGADTS